MSRPGVTVSVLVIQSAVRSAEAAGVAAGRALKEASIDERLFADPDARVPLSAEEAVWEALVKLSGDEAFGLTAARATPRGSFDVLEHAMAASETFGDALSVLARYNRLLHDVAQFEIERTSDVVRVSHRFAGDARGATGAIADYTLGMFVHVGRALCKRDWTPRRVRFRHAAPNDLRPYRALFSAPVEFDAPDNQLELDPAVLDLPLAGADPSLSRVLLRYAEARAAALPAPDDLAAQVKDAIGKTLANGPKSLSEVARALGLSARTLQRRLTDEGLSHTELVDEVRRSLAIAWVAERRLVLSEIAFALGYSEPRAFHRAYRRWTGNTPGAERARS